MKCCQSITECIGNTPLLKLNRLSENANIYAKCEFLNPISLKDRPVLHIINEAEKIGILKPGSTLIESTSGNTGMSIAYMAAIKGYKAILVMSEIQSIERRKILKAFGAELVLTPASEGTAGARKRMFEIIQENPDYFYVGQHVNQNNPKSHYLTTGPEIWMDSEGKVDFFVAGLGTGGTICGVGKYLKERNPNIKIVAIEPANAPYISKGTFSPHRIMGLAPGFTPETLDMNYIDEIELVTEEEAFRMCNILASKEGVFVGITSGAVGCVMRRLAEKDENRGKNIIGIMADTGQRYLSVDGLF